MKMEKRTVYVPQFTSFAAKQPQRKENKPGQPSFKSTGLNLV